MSNCFLYNFFFLKIIIYFSIINIILGEILFLFNRKKNYLMYDCEFQEDGSNLLLISAKNRNFAPFIGKSFARDIWDMISKADVTCDMKHYEMHNYLLDHLKKGNTVFDQLESNILLKKDEYVKFQSFNSVELFESRSVRVSKSAHSGRRSRNMGISYGIGNSVSVSESFDELKKVDVGQITITNKRFIFSGAKKSVDVDIKKITSITPYTDGIKLQRKNKQKVEYFVNLDHYVFTREWGGETYLFFLDGDMVKALIESSLDEYRYISDLQKFEAQSIPRICNNDADFKSWNNDDISFKYPSSWTSKNLDGSIFNIINNRDNYFCEISVFKDDLSKVNEDPKNKVLNTFENLKFNLAGVNDIKINDIDMVVASALAYTDGVLREMIFSYFIHNNICFYIRMHHKFYSNAKNEYFELLNSINIDSNTNFHTNLIK